MKSEAAIALGKRLRLALATRDLSQANLAHMLGVSVTQISDWVSGRHRPTKATRALIASLLRLNERWLTEGTGPIYKEGASGESRVAEPPEIYGEGLDREDRTIIKEMEGLLRQGLSPELKQHLKAQLRIVRDAQKIRAKRASGGD